jgi:hypothetical protein
VDATSLGSSSRRRLIPTCLSRQHLEPELPAKGDELRRNPHLRIGWREVDAEEEGGWLLALDGDLIADDLDVGIVGTKVRVGALNRVKRNDNRLFLITVTGPSLSQSDGAELPLT